MFSSSSFFFSFLVALLVQRKSKSVEDVPVSSIRGGRENCRVDNELVNNAVETWDAEEDKLRGSRDGLEGRGVEGRNNSPVEINCGPSGIGGQEKVVGGSWADQEQRAGEDGKSSRGSVHDSG